MTQLVRKLHKILHKFNSNLNIYHYLTTLLHNYKICILMIKEKLQRVYDTLKTSHKNKQTKFVCKQTFK